VLKGNSAKSMTIDNDGNMKIRPPVTAEKHQQDIWNAIKERFSENAESKKMQKSILKQKFEEFKISKEEGLDKGYEKMQKILTQMNTLKIKPKPEDFLEIDTKGYSSSSSTLSNAAFVSTAGSSQGNLSYQELGDGGYTTTLSVSSRSSSSKGSSKSKFSVVDDVIYSFFANHEIDQHLKYKSKEAGKDGSDSKDMVVVDDADSEGEVVSADDAILAGVSVSASNVAAAVASPHSETEFAFMGISTEAKWNNSGKNLYKLINSSISVRTK
nr:xylulose kinase-1 [Tanacetum cinerariifolium]